MSISLLAPLCALLYLAATGLQLLHLSQRHEQIDRGVFVLSLFALLLHALIVWKIVFLSEGVALGFFKIVALLFLVINLACITSLSRRPLQNLLIALYPLSALAVLISTFAPDTAPLLSHLSNGMILHISSSILAYAAKPTFDSKDPPYLPCRTAS